MDTVYHIEDLIAALATPRGRGALAIIRTSGEGCVEGLASRFSRPEALIESEGGRVHHGWILDGDGERIDEVLITVFRNPVSYTGQDSAEISCHGGPAVVDRILEVLRNSGFRDAAPGEFTFRAFSNGKMDLTRAEAVKEIIDARTDRARALAVSRLSGSVESVINSVKDIVRRQSAVAALALDYPEDEAEPVPFDIPLIRQARDDLAALIQTWRTGRLYHDGLTVALAGPANAGKSSLFNLFLKEERSIVTERPGTTRDWLEAWLNLDGIPLRLVDTAGLRRGTEDPIEVEGIRRTRDLLAGSDLVVAVADGTLGEQAAADLEEEELAVLESKSDRLIRVWNKADLAPDGPKGWIPVSAVTGFGFVDLEQAIRLRALGGAPPPEAGAPVIDSARQKDLMEVAVKAMDRFLGGTGSEGQTPIDLLSEDLYEALDALGELTGTVTRTDVLETLFGEFCVGK
jgi:tRNA modification GTPase